MLGRKPEGDGNGAESPEAKLAFWIAAVFAIFVVFKGAERFWDQGNDPLNPQTKRGDWEMVDASPLLQETLHESFLLWKSLSQRQSVTWDPPYYRVFAGERGQKCHGLEKGAKVYYCDRDGVLYISEDWAAILQSSQAWRVQYSMAQQIARHVRLLPDMLSFNDWELAMQRRAIRQAENEEERLALSQKFHLQSECFVGVWLSEAEKKGQFGDLAKVTIANLVSNTDGSRDWLGETYDQARYGRPDQRANQIALGMATGVFSSCSAMSHVES